MLTKYVIVLVLASAGLVQAVPVQHAHFPLPPCSRSGSGKTVDLDSNTVFGRINEVAFGGGPNGEMTVSFATKRGMPLFIDPLVFPDIGDGDFIAFRKEF
ncbi:hypothetical protein BDM02DRAFT_3109458 [Thelephora ganbajun]|uniref:Uncharacterized protein n=1 Tax=Thelephora ganbajun TaxID=370292 RepID=A0ACB6ZTI2_THEGA|nr:hypothetical protein BDM02DRAFT_3109458 [Thelephora ganbajun]